MKFTAALSSLLLAAPAFAQTTPPGFTPVANQILDIYYGTQYITPGLVVKKSVTQKAPVIGVANGTLTGKYLLAMIDIDGSQGGKTTTVLHALLQDYTPSGTTQNGTAVLTTKATGPSSYFGPAPPAGQPPTHRYVFLLHEQPANFAVPAAHKQAVSSRFAIDWPKFITDAGLSAPLYGNYLQVKSGDNTKRWVA
ncbi:PEBP-like protein [Cucurbitaria berberidis CBS 394.84]|uniref:PEBP-like protein n=1 Tax=Cucurbitaria berberidis CBS 394.84 TaxID=1168544 RepID=A0A9P4GIQ0_9PLEO|nr:PEBP-like protein [Cucurbitaria berberidis CBS 394.84]KAF1845906.1 PEBP-like protein [Cucurbitaria berberidis CBS 394.84]